jgi:putative intracellular protease/amidase
MSRSVLYFLKQRTFLWGALAAVVLVLAVGAGGIASLPPTPSHPVAQPVEPSQTSATLAALAPPKRARPLVAIIGLNDATETTDYLMPYGILRRANVADVVALATGPGPVKLYPALQVEADATIAQFDAGHAEGADYVIVPAMSRDDDPAALAWIRGQAAKGAIIIGVCAGAKVVGAAGLLDGRQATTHWFFLDDLRERSPSMRYVADRRFVVDRGVATTTGISASMPMSLTLIEAIAGRDNAQAVARDLGVAQWDARHVSAAFKITRPFALTVMGNVLAFWNREQVGIEMARGVDEVSLALVADAWSRTYRSRAVTFAPAPGAVESRNGLRILPDRVAAGWPADRRLPALGAHPPAQALHEALAGIESRYGSGTADVVAMQLELPRHKGLQ